MITHDARRSLSRGNNPVPSPWLATPPATSMYASEGSRTGCLCVSLSRPASPGTPESATYAC